MDSGIHYLIIQNLTNSESKNAKSNYNININFPIINEIYILIYNSLPFSKNIFNDYHYLFYRPFDSASSGG